MICYDMLCYVMLCYVVLYYVMLYYVMLCYIMLSHVMLCCVMLWQYAQTFYMCLESLVGCMKENFGSFTYFSDDGTILRSFAKYFWAEGILKER